MIRAIRSASLRSIHYVLIGFICIAVLYLAFGPQIQKAGAQGKARQATKYVPPHHPPTNQTVYAPLMDLSGQMEAEIVLNNRSSHEMKVTPTFYSISGQAFNADPIALKPSEVRYFAITGLLPRELSRNKVGGVSLNYLGSPMEVAAQVTLVCKNPSGSADITLLGAMDYRSTIQEAVWWLPNKGTAVMVLGNSFNSLVTANLRYASGEVQAIKLEPYATEVVRRSGHPLTTEGAVDSVRIETTGPVGSLRATGFVTDQGGRIISNIRFYDPQNIRQPHLFATRLHVKDNSSRMVLKNTSDVVISARPRFLPSTGEAGTAFELPAVTIKPHQAIEVDLKPLSSTAATRDDLHVVSVQVLNDGQNGSLIGALCSTNQAKQTVYDVPLRDSGPLRNSTGSYPWRLDGDYSTTISITNVGPQPAGFIASIKYDGGQYLPQSRILAVGETAVFDLRKIRNEQIADKDGKILPRMATIGQFHWSILRGGDNVKLVGRGEMLSSSRRVSSSYSCPVCCPDSLSYLAGRPGGPIIPQSGFLAVYVDGVWIDCHNNTVGPYGYPYTASWWCENPSVVSFTTSGDHYDANGLAAGISLVEASAQDYYYTDDGMDCYPILNTYTAPDTATVVQVTFQKSDGSQLPSPLRAGVSSASFDRKQSLRAVVSPASAAASINIQVSGKLDLSNVSTSGNTITFNVVGKAGMKSDSRGDQYVRARYNPSGPNFDHPVSVVVPSKIGTPHETFSGTVTGVNRVVSRTSTPPFPDVPSGKVWLLTFYARTLNVLVWDQFNDPIGDLYAGAAISEGGIAINVTLTSASTYPDIVGTAISRDYPITVDYMPSDPIVLTWPSDSPTPLYVGGTARQDIAVEVDGFALSPAVVNRTWTATPPNSLVITWPD